MRLTKNNFIWVIILIELIGLLIIGDYVYNKLRLRKGVLGAKTVFSPISKENIVSSSSGELKYYYEYKPNTNQDYQPEWMPKKVTYTINADTLNERYDYTVEKQPDTFRIITLGDSFTFGVGVDTANNWPEQLEDELNNKLHCSKIKKFEVINLGMGGFGVDYIYHRYLEHGVKYNPDLIVWLEAGSGFDRVNELLETYLQKVTPTITDEQRNLARKRGNFFLDWTLGIEEMYKDYSQEQIADLVGKSWEKFFESRGTTPIIIAMPSDSLQKQFDQIGLWIKDQQNVTVDNTISPLTQKKLQLPDTHPNILGHKTIADNIFQYLQKYNFANTCKQ